MKKVLFLDVDGVLNRCGQSGPDLESDKVELLDHIIKSTNCLVVLSSTWRRYEHHSARIETMLRTMGSCLYGKTPAHDGQADLLTPASRGGEIAAWLTLHPDVTRFVILDDCNDMAHLESHLVLTNSFVGLIPSIAGEVIRRLNAPSFQDAGASA